MVIVRESPRAKHSPGKPQVQWPPSSPFEALISSPSGRKRWQDMQEQKRARSVSPSARGARLQPSAIADHDSQTADNLDEDEEALKLELEILETKKKLRDLAKKKRDHEELASRSPRSTTERTSPLKRRRLSPVGSDVGLRSIQIAVSPSRSHVDTAIPVSPARARLGIEYARAEQVSLKRPSNATAALKSQITRGTSASVDRPVSSFSERLAQARSTGQEKQDKSDRLNSIRSKSFASLTSSTSTPTTSAPSSHSSLSKVSGYLPAPKHYAELVDKAAPKTNRSLKSKDPAFYDPFSDIHLKSRTMPHTEVAQKLAGSEIYTLPRLLKEVTGPEYDAPDCESDYVVFGILAEKTTPFETKATHKIVDQHKDDTRMAKNKFMVLRLCDLKWQVDLYLFGTGLEKYWKLTEGTLLAILNPGILPPRGNLHNGQFSLKIASSEDCILEIGAARDLGTCASIKKDGNQCSSWVNKVKSEFCEFHINMQLGRARKGRMEVNSMWRGSSPEAKPKPRVKRNPNMMHHTEYGQLWAVGGVTGRSSAGLIDDDIDDELRKISQKEASEKRIAAKQHERDLLTKLEGGGGGVAGEYFRAKHGIDNASMDASAASRGEAVFVKPKAAELGLLSRNANDQRLSPAKDRRRHFGVGAISSAGTEAMGWGGSRKYGLLQPRAHRVGSPERGQTTLDSQTRSILRSPVRGRSASPQKSARFMLDQGVRVPGRESGGIELGSFKENDDNDDDLDIV